jgi:hypothetical protein
MVIASQPFSCLEIVYVVVMFEAIAIYSAGSWDDIIGTVWETTAIGIVNFLKKG